MLDEASVVSQLKKKTGPACATSKQRTVINGVLVYCAHPHGDFTDTVPTNVARDGLVDRHNIRCVVTLKQDNVAVVGHGISAKVVIGSFPVCRVYWNSQRTASQTHRHTAGTTFRQTDRKERQKDKLTNK